MIEKDVQHSFNVGYLFLQDIYYKLKLNEICDTITEKHQFKFDLNDILSKLIYSRIIFPASKLKTLELSKRFLEQPNFEYQHIERALPIICENMDFIQSELYKNSNQKVDNSNIKKGSDEKVKTYINGSTSETVYADTDCTVKIGSLNPREKCDCFGIFEKRAMVRYKVSGKNNYKIGFCKWTGGVK